MSGPTSTRPDWSAGLPKPSINVTLTPRWMSMNPDDASAEGFVIMNNLTMTMIKLQELAQGQSDIIMATRMVPRTPSNGEAATGLNASTDSIIQNTMSWLTMNPGLASREGRVIMNNLGVLFAYASGLVATDKEWLGRHVRHHKMRGQQNSKADSASSAAEGKEAAPSTSIAMGTVAWEGTDNETDSQAEHDDASDVSDEESFSSDEDERLLACGSSFGEVDEMYFD